jgi:cytidine deaminase
MSSLPLVNLSAQQRATYKKLLDQAVRVRDYAYAPNSRSKVGAAALGKSGRVYLGINCELTGQADHAEQVAINQALLGGERAIEAIAVFVAHEGEVQEEHYDKNSCPCGNCRQALFELNPEMLVIQADGLHDVKAFRLADMLPNAYKRTWPPIKIPPAAPEHADRLIYQALRARAGSFAVRSGYPEGAAVETECGNTYLGLKVELSSFTSRAVRMAIASAFLNGDRKITRLVVAAGLAGPECPQSFSWDCIQSIFQTNPQIRIVTPNALGVFVEHSAPELMGFVMSGLHSPAWPIVTSQLAAT